MQNIANVLTKANAEKETLREFLRDSMLTLAQSESNKIRKGRKRQQRQRRNVVVIAAKNATQVDADRRRRIAAAEIGADAAFRIQAGKRKQRM